MMRTPVRAVTNMEPLTPLELEELRKMLHDEHLTNAQKDDLIRTVDHIIQSFILAARGLGSTKLSLSARANASFQFPRHYDSVIQCDNMRRVDLDHPDAGEGEIEPQSPTLRHRRPDQP